jgi:hypothetical protein
MADVDLDNFDCCIKKMTLLQKQKTVTEGMKMKFSLGLRNVNILQFPISIFNLACRSYGKSYRGTVYFAPISSPFPFLLTLAVAHILPGLDLPIRPDFPSEFRSDFRLLLKFILWLILRP